VNILPIINFVGFLGDLTELVVDRSSSYVDDLSVKKQDKALIHARRARNIKTVLIDPKDTAIESAQFRYCTEFPSLILH